MEERLRKLGTEKTKEFNEDFDKFYDLYKQKAVATGYNGELKFIRERGKILIYVVL